MYIDSEKTDYYGRFSYRYSSARILEYVLSSDGQYRSKFIEVSKSISGEFSEFCNFLINDVNQLLFDGILALEEIKNFEEKKEDVALWSMLSEEEKE